MKILLTAVNAKYIHSNLAVYSLRAAAGEYKEYVEIAEFTINNQADYILKEIYKRKPDILMFSCYIWNLNIIEKVMREFHKLCPEVPIWLGGPEVSYEETAFMEAHPEVTGVMLGEGEVTFRELCEYYYGKYHNQYVRFASLTEIEGIAYRRMYSLFKDIRELLGKEAFCRMVRAFGAERILFGTDFPVVSAGMTVGGVLFEHVTPEEQRMIFRDNFLRLTGYTI